MGLLRRSPDCRGVNLSAVCFFNSGGKLDNPLMVLPGEGGMPEGDSESTRVLLVKKLYFNQFLGGIIK